MTDYVEGVRKLTDESNVLEPIGFCAVCEEGIYSWERAIHTEVDGEEFVVHNRPGCRDIWDEIRGNPRKCTICDKKTQNMIFFGGGYFIVCEGECMQKLKERIGG